MMQKRFGLPAEERIRKRDDFERVFQQGKRLRSGPIFARWVPNGLDHPRMAVAIRTAFGNSPQRNRAKRLLREAYRLNKHEMPAGIDIIFLPSYDWNAPHLTQLEEAMRHIAGMMRRAIAGSEGEK